MRRGSPEHIDYFGRPKRGPALDRAAFLAALRHQPPTHVGVYYDGAVNPERTALMHAALQPVVVNPNNVPSAPPASPGNPLVEALAEIIRSKLIPISPPQYPQHPFPISPPQYPQHPIDLPPGLLPPQSYAGMPQGINPGLLAWLLSPGFYESGFMSGGKGPQ